MGCGGGGGSGCVEEGFGGVEDEGGGFFLKLDLLGVVEGCGVVAVVKGVV